MQTGTVSRLRFCGRSWGLKIHFWRNLVHLRKSYICSCQLDVQETNLSFAQFNRIRNHLFGRWIEIRRYSLDLWDLIVLVLGNTTQNHDWTERPVVCRDKSHVQGQSRGMFNVLDNVDLAPSNVQLSHQEALLYVFEDNEAWNLLCRKNTKTTLQAKEILRWPITIWCTNLFRCLNRWKLRMRKQQWTRNGRNSKRFQPGSWRKSRAKNKEVILEAHRNKKESTLLHWWTCVISRTRRQRKSRTPKGHCKRRLRTLRRICWTKLICVTNDCRKSYGCPMQDNQTVTDKQPTRYLLAFKQRWKMLPDCSEFWKSECPDLWIRLPRHKWTTSWTNIEDPMVPLERNLYGRPLAGLLRERQFEEVVMELGWEKSTELGMSFCSSKKDYSYRRTWMTSKWLEEIRIWHQCSWNWWNTLIETRQLPFMTMYIWDVLDVNANWTKLFFEQYEEVLESRISAGTTEKLQGWEKPHTKTVAWSYDMEGDAQKCVERHCELANKETEQLYKVSSPCLDDHNFKTEELEPIGEFIRCMLTNCLAILEHGTNWHSRHFMDSTQTCSIRHKMDKSKWPTSGTLDLLHSSHKWLPTILSCGWHGSALFIGFIPRLRFCWRPSS